MKITTSTIIALVISISSAICQIDIEVVNVSNKRFESIQYAGNGVVYACGEIDNLYKSSDYGATWNLINTGFSSDHLRLHFFDESIGWVGLLDGTVIKTLNNGTTWQSFSTGAYEISDIQFVGLDTGWVAGSNYNNPYLYGVYKTTSGGANWSLVYSSLSVFFRDIHFVNGQLGYGAAYAADTQDAGIYQTVDGGTTWNLMVGGIVFSRLAFIDASNGYALGTVPGTQYENLIYRFADGSWTEVSERPDNAFWCWSMDVTENGVVWLAANAPFGTPNNDGFILRSESDGINIALAGVIDNHYAYALDIINDTLGFVGCESGVVAILVAPEPNSVQSSNTDDKAVTLYPNPAVDFINAGVISSLRPVDEIRIYALSGKLVMKEFVLPLPNNSVHLVNTNSLQSGIYLIEFLNLGEKLACKKFIIDRN